jgi:hypothetical protein
MNKRQRRYIKREALKNKEWEKEKKDNKRSIIMIILMSEVTNLHAVGLASKS